MRLKQAGPVLNDLLIVLILDCFVVLWWKFRPLQPEEKKPMAEVADLRASPF